MGDREKGLIDKYRVERVDGKPVKWCFVLEDKDPLIVSALRAYADAAQAVGYEKLAQDLRQKAGQIRNVRMARLIRVERIGVNERIIIDGQEFPWFTLEGRTRLEVSREKAPSLAIEIPADRVDVVDDITAESHGEPERSPNQSDDTDDAPIESSHESRVNGLIAEVNRRGARIAELAGRIGELERSNARKVRSGLLSDAAYWLQGIVDRGWVGVARDDESSYREVASIVAALREATGDEQGDPVLD